MFIADFALLQLCSTANQSKPVRFLTHDLGNATYIDEFNTLRGLPGGGKPAFLVELVRAMMLQAGDVSLVEEVPFVRGLLLIARRENYAFFHLIRTVERDELYKWVGPIYDSPSHFYQHVNRAIEISSITQAKEGTAVCGVRGTYNLKWLKRHKFRHILVANSFNSCLQLLDYGRVKLVMSTEHSSVLMERPFAKDILVPTGLSNRSELLEGELPGYGYIAFSRGVDDADIERWQVALEEVRTSGTYDALMQKFLGRQTRPVDE